MDDKLLAKQTKKLETSIAKEAKADEKYLQHASKALQAAQKGHNKAEKAAYKADSAHEKAMKKEQKTAKKLNNAAHTHDVALTNEKKTEHDITLCQKSKTDAEHNVLQKQAELEAAQKRKADGQVVRERRLSDARQSVIRPTAGGAAAGDAGSDIV